MKRGRRTVGRAALALAVVAVVVAGEEGSVDVSRVGDGLAEAVSGERHGGYVCWFGGGGGRKSSMAEGSRLGIGGVWDGLKMD